MAGKKSFYASSPSVGATKTMLFPYSTVSSWIGVGCDGKNTWVYFGFSDSPNLNNTVTKSGYHLINTKVRWDQTISDAKLRQEWGSKFLHFNESKKCYTGSFLA